MGQKVNPIGLRLGINKTWASRWFATGDQYGDFLHEDFRLRKYISKKLKHAGVAGVDLERAANKVKVIIRTARPGVVIGKKGAGIDSLKTEIQKLTENEVFVNIQEVRKPDGDANLVAQNIANQLERRMSWRRVLKKSLQASLRAGVKGIKVQVAGRLDGAEIARSEWYTEKSVPLHTLRADIDYGTAEALTQYGIIGIKVWIYKGDLLVKQDLKEEGSRA
ncbi:MAG: 30S ribosomal protein S3 [Bdellovibrionales bacterium]